MVTRSRHNVTLYVQCLSGFITYWILPGVYVKNQLPNIRVFASVKYYALCVRSVCWHQNSLRVTTLTSQRNEKAQFKVALKRYLTLRLLMSYIYIWSS